jgi:protein-disulfide isomerase
MGSSSLAVRIGVGVAVVVAAVVAILLVTQRDSGTSAAAPASTAAAAESPSGSGTGAASSAAVVREDSHILGDPADGAVTVVEFLDFECESCLAWYPVIEQLRDRYAGEVRFVARYFPLPSHLNSVNAALAVEAAAQQGRFEDMYIVMFGTQETWGHSGDSQAPLFRTFAQELGLDLEAYDAAVADPATLARVEKDQADGESLGVQGTPTFFLNGELIQPMGPDDFGMMIDKALAEASA